MTQYQKNVLGSDPYVLFDSVSGYYYCYTTSEDWYDKEQAFYIYKSKDLLNWEFVRYALDLKDKNTWGKDWYWAPECYYNPNNNHYYLFYSARVKTDLVEKYFEDPQYLESCRIGVAVSKSPEGPFVNITNEPLDYYPFDNDYISICDVSNNVFELNDATLLKNAPKGKYIPIIDVNLLFDDDRIFMYFSRCCYMNCRYDEKYKKFIEESNVAGIELETDWWFDKEAKMMPKVKEKYRCYDPIFKRRRDKFITLISYEKEQQEWENKHINDYENFNKTRRNRRWAEGSTTFIMNINNTKKYCLTYSCNYFIGKHYGVGIAFSDEPLKDYKKYENNPIIVQNEKESVFSTGHGSVVYYNDELYYFLHGRDKIDNPRILYVTKLKIENNKVEHTELIKCKLIK